MPNLSLLIVILLSTLLSGCIGGAWTGGSLLYDRHHVYKKLSDYQLSIALNEALFPDLQLRSEHRVIDITVFNGYVLLSGHLPTQALYDLAAQRIRTMQGYSHLFNAITISQAHSRNLEDAWITSKIRSQMFANSEIDPKAFKIVTTDGQVYVLGEVKREQGQLVIDIARQTEGVIRVVNCLRYFTYQ
jgi:osmotically-inducible protein OsmY